MMKRLLSLLVFCLYFAIAGAQTSLDTNWVNGTSRIYSFNLDDYVVETDGVGNYYALIIGVEEYDDPGFPDLKNPVNDATRLDKILRDFYTFNQRNTVFLKNPTKREVGQKFDSLSRRITENDNLLIFYAGTRRMESEFKNRVLAIVGCEKSRSDHLAFQ